MIVWHYAVWKWSSGFMEPACVKSRYDTPNLEQHGITIVRGDVNCPDCKRMMGMV